MNKNELVEVVDHANALWSKDVYPDDLKKQRKAWWSFMHDLDYNAVIKVINNVALSATYQPRVGEIRRRVIMGTLPTAIEGWQELQSARVATQTGSMPPPLSPIVKKTVERLGSQTAGLQSNGDRDKFCELFNVVLTEHVEQVCAVKPTQD